MNRKRRFKKHQPRRVVPDYICCGSIRSRLSFALLFIGLVSMTLNVYFLFFRDVNVWTFERSAVDASHNVFNKWAAEFHQSEIGSVQKLETATEVRFGKNESPSNKIHGSVLHEHIKTKVTKAVIKESEKDEGRIKTNTTKSHTPIKGSMPKCPLNPAGLVGSLKARTDDITPEELRKLFHDVENGGRIRPRNCVPRERLAVIIPFRNRYQHLYILLLNLIPFLQRQMTDATIFIIEQAPNTTFNRGALLNIGFLEALKSAKFDCFILHDVDLIPLNDWNFYRCGKNPRHYAVAMNKFGFKLMYDKYFGGVVGFSKKQYINVNGNSNLYFGWGGEDDDLWSRTFNKNYTVDRYDLRTSRYMMIKHKGDVGNDKNSERRKILKSGLKRQDIEGLNTTKYKVNSIKLDQLYTWINVSLDMMEILDTAPFDTRHDIWRLVKSLEKEKAANKSIVTTKKGLTRN
uniref:Beta-1,4-galactosyltransferase n=1 Tax=Arion vulgaris TaxID=1028688 RepID=A0A0B7B315_9EUPU